MAMTVWGAGTARTLRVHWALAELGLPYETRPVGSRTGETQSAAFRALSVKEKIPVLVVRGEGGAEDVVLTESAAIVTYLGERQEPGRKHGGLVPPPGSLARGRYYEWMSFTLMELDAHTLYVMRKHGDLRRIYGAAPAAMDAARQGFEKQLGWALPRLEEAPFLVGGEFTGVDILMTTCLDWAVAYGFDLPPPCHAYRERHHARPAYQQAVAANAPKARPQRANQAQGGALRPTSEEKGIR